MLRVSCMLSPCYKYTYLLGKECKFMCMLVWTNLSLVLVPFLFDNHTAPSVAPTAVAAPVEPGKIHSIVVPCVCLYMCAG